MALTESCALSLPTGIDADGLNILASNSDIRSKVHPQCILSPHPGEMARLLSDSTQNIQSDRLGAARSLANELSCVLILKGARTIIVGSEGDTWICPISDSSLATAGSGDVLTGILAALLSRGLPAESAACLGVFVHGVAGEVRTELNGGYLGTIASDIARVSAVVLNSLVELSKLSIPPRAKCIDVIPGASDRVRSLILSRADCS
jgi:NAD(P)H-hydrate epimerase